MGSTIPLWIDTAGAPCPAPSKTWCDGPRRPAGRSGPLCSDPSRRPSLAAHRTKCRQPTPFNSRCVSFPPNVMSSSMASLATAPKKRTFQLCPDVLPLASILGSHRSDAARSASTLASSDPPIGPIRPRCIRHGAPSLLAGDPIRSSRYRRRARAVPGVRNNRCRDGSGLRSALAGRSPADRPALPRTMGSPG